MSKNPKGTEYRVSDLERQRIERERAEQAARERALIQQQLEIERKRREEAQRIAWEKERQRQEIERQRREEEARLERERQERLRLERLAIAKSGFCLTATAVRQKTEQIGRHQAHDSATTSTLTAIQSELSVVAKTAEGAQDENLLTSLQEKLREFDRKVLEVERLLNQRESLCARIEQCLNDTTTLTNTDTSDWNQRLNQLLQNAKTVNEKTLPSLDKQIGVIEREVATKIVKEQLEKLLKRAGANFDAIESQAASMDTDGYTKLLGRLQQVRKNPKEQELVDLDAEITSYRRDVVERYHEHCRKRDAAEERAKILAARLGGIRATVNSLHAGNESIVNSLEDRFKSLTRLSDRGDFDGHQRGIVDIDQGIDNLLQRIQLQDDMNQLEELLQQSPSRIFDKTERNALTTSIQTLRTEINRERYESVTQSVGTLSDRIRIHVEAENAKEQKRIQEISQWREKLQERESNISALLNVLAVSTWVKPELDDAREELSKIEGLLDGGDFEILGHRFQRWDNSLTETLNKANEDQLKEDKRQFYVERVKTALNELSFENVSADLENSEDPRSVTVIKVNWGRGRKLDIRIDPRKEKENVQYIPDGLDFAELSYKGETYRTCDDTLDKIEKIHNKLREKGEIDAGPVIYPQMPPGGTERDIPSDVKSSKQEPKAREMKG